MYEMVDDIDGTVAEKRMLVFFQDIALVDLGYTVNPLT
jgi:hypothetical protein